MQGIIKNLVGKVLRAHLDYTFDSQTIDLYIAPELSFKNPWPTALKQRISGPLLYWYPNAEGKIRHTGETS